MIWDSHEKTDFSHKLALKSMTKIMGKTAIWANSCFYPFPLLINVEKERPKLVSSYVMGSQHCIKGEGDF